MNICILFILFSGHTYITDGCYYDYELIEPHDVAYLSQVPDYYEPYLYEAPVNYVRYYYPRRHYVTHWKHYRYTAPRIIHRRVHRPHHVVHRHHHYNKRYRHHKSGRYGKQHYRRHNNKRYNNRRYKNRRHNNRHYNNRHRSHNQRNYRRSNRQGRRVVRDYYNNGRRVINRHRGSRGRKKR